jgi:hypothetical protein
MQRAVLLPSQACPVGFFELLFSVKMDSEYYCAEANYVIQKVLRAKAVSFTETVYR